MGRARRLVLAIVSAAMLATASGAPVAVMALGDVAVTLSCSDGSRTDLRVDTTTLLELKDAVEAMTLYPAGLSCSLTEIPTLGAFGAGVVLAASGQSDFAVGGGQWLPCPTVAPTGVINFSISAHVHANGNVNGQIGETIPKAIPGPCASISAGLPPGHYKADVQCVFVSGNMAGGTALVTQASGFFADIGFIPGTTTVGFGITDLGNPSGPLRDTLLNFPGANCSPTGGSFDLVRGNFVVRDSPTAP
jgi:hypothetical protein